MCHSTTPGLTSPPVESAPETRLPDCVGKYLSETMSRLPPLACNPLKSVFHSLKRLWFCLQKGPGAAPPAGERQLKGSILSVMGAVGPLADVGAGGNAEPARSFLHHVLKVTESRIYRERAAHCFVFSLHFFFSLTGRFAVAQFG